MVKVLYDITMLGRSHSWGERITGVYRATIELAKALANHDECEMTLCSPGYWEDAVAVATADPDLSQLQFARNRVTVSGPSMRMGLQRPLVNALSTYYDRKEAGKLSLLHRVAGGVMHRSWEFLGQSDYMPKVSRRVLKEAQVYHQPALALPEFVRENDKLIVFQTIYDLIPIKMPQVCIEGQIQFSKQLLRQSKDTDWFCTDSRSAKDDLCEVKGVDPSRVFVTYLAADRDKFYPCVDEEKKKAVRKLYGIPEGPYVLSVCTLEPRKNLVHIMRCFAALVRQGEAPDLNLVLTGVKGWKTEGIFAEIEAQADLRDRIIVTGYVADSDLAALYSDAIGFVFMSLYEGFGLPVLEAMQCGTPVITSNTSSLPEVAGDAAILLDPKDADGLSGSMLRIYRDTSLRADLSRRGKERAQQFNWERCAEDTMHAYSTAMEMGRG